MDEESILIIAEESGERIDALLARTLPAFSRSLIQKQLAAGAVLLNGAPAKKNARLEPGDRIEFLPPETEELPLLAQEIPLSIVYEDSDLIVVDKPRGLVVHPAPGHPDATLVNARFVKPFDTQLLRALSASHRLIAVMEENNRSGALGEHVADFCEREKLSDRDT